MVIFTSLMIDPTKSKLIGYLLLILSIAPLLYVIAFLSFLYYTGNGFGQPLTYIVFPEKQETYLTWIDLIMTFDTIWLFTLVFWAVVVFFIIFLKDINVKSPLLISTLVFIPAIYISYFSGYAGSRGWIGEYLEAVKHL